MMMGGGWFVGLIVLVLVLFLVGGGIAAVVWFARQGSHSLSQGPRQEPRQGSEALDVLRQRYARGEIDREEFERMRADLNH
jgi:putative membrane protein